MEEMDKHSNRGEHADVESNSNILELNGSINNEGRPTSSPLETKDSTRITTEEICSVTDRALEISLSNANGEKEDEANFSSSLCMLFSFKDNSDEEWPEISMDQMFSSI